MIKHFFRVIDIVPLLGVVVCLIFYSVETPCSDDWDMIPIIAKIKQGTLTWADLNAPYVGHKMVTAYALLGVVAIESHWNTYVLEGTNLLILVGAWLALRPWVVKSGQLFAAAVLFWSWSQYVNWFWPWQIACSMAIFCIVWTVRLLESDRYGNFFLAMVLAWMGTLSYGAGWAIWPAIFFLMMRTKRDAAQWALCVLTFLLAALCFLQSQSSIHRDLSLSDYLSMPAFCLNALGGPVAPEAHRWAMLFALAAWFLLLCPGVLSKSKPAHVALLVAALGMVILITLTRSGGGYDIENGLQPRYRTMEMLFWMSVVIIVPWTGWKRNLLTLVVVACLLEDAYNISALRDRRETCVRGVEAILRQSPDRIALKGYQTSLEAFDADNQLLRKWHYSFYR